MQSAVGHSWESNAGIVNENAEHYLSPPWASTLKFGWVSHTQPKSSTMPVYVNTALHITHGPYLKQLKKWTIKTAWPHESQF